MTSAKNEAFMGFCYLEGRGEGWWQEPLMRRNINVAGGGYCRMIFSSGGMNKISAFFLVGNTLIFRHLLFKETTCINRVLTRSQR